MIFLSIHGIHNDPRWLNWQDEFGEVLTVSGFGGIRHVSFKYPFVTVPTKVTPPKLIQDAICGAFSFLARRHPFVDRYADFASLGDRVRTVLNTGPTVQEAVAQFTESIHGLLSWGEPLHIFAHSLGCYVAVKSIENVECEDYAINSLRLMAPPLLCDYDLQKVSSKTRKAWVEYSPQDDFLAALESIPRELAERIVPDWADTKHFAGLMGFTHLPDNFIQQCYSGFVHSDFVTPLRALQAWLPDLCLMPPVDEVQWYDRNLRAVARDCIDAYFLGYDPDDLSLLYDAVESLILTGSCTEDATIRGPRGRITVEGIRCAVGNLLASYINGLKNVKT